MLNINIILNNPKEIQKKLLSRGYKLNIDAIKIMHEGRKELIKIKENIAADKNKLNNKFREASTEDEKNKIREQSQKFEKEIDKNKRLLEEKELELNSLLLDIPNVPLDNVPIGESELDNKIIKTWGTTKKNKFDHSSLFLKNGLLNFESGAKLSKTRFVVMKGKVAKLHRSLISYMLHKHTDVNNYIEYNVPYIVNNVSMTGTGQLPKFRDDLFKIQDSDLYLIPTAEVPLTNLYRDKLLDEQDLPIHMVAHTPCFRSEAGSYGKDTKGIIRQHQFEKVELVHITKPDEAEKSLDSITMHAEKLMEDLEIPYQRVLLSTGDLGFSASKTYDIEAWFPSQENYREISSCSLFSDFQSRRLNIKFKNTSTNKKEFVYTLNGSGLAIGRTMAALIENHTDGKIINIPKVLQPITGFDVIKL
tara:strand:- start:61 stop:1317 length:1257 start_codon:yes stop_codon:yes gene_type:complete